MNRTGKYFDDFSFGIPHFLKTARDTFDFYSKKIRLAIGASRPKGIIVPLFICRINLSG